MDRWVAAIPARNVAPTVKIVLLYLVATERVSPRGYVTFEREAVAGELGMHPQRLSDYIRTARNDGLLDKRGGGYVGRTAEYEVVIPAGQR